MPDLGEGGGQCGVRRSGGSAPRRLLDSGLSESDIKLMTSLNPARLIGLS